MERSANRRALARNCLRKSFPAARESRKGCGKGYSRSLPTTFIISRAGISGTISLGREERRKLFQKFVCSPRPAPSECSPCLRIPVSVLSKRMQIVCVCCCLVAFFVSSPPHHTHGFVSESTPGDDGKNIIHRACSSFQCEPFIRGPCCSHFSQAGSRGHLWLLKAG